MGVKNLWDILESCKKTLPLHHLQNKRVCIDLSCWMVQLQSVNRSHCAMKDKLYLKGLFHRLRALIALNCNLIFVTDGSIPALKVATYRRRLNPLSEIARDDDADSKKPSSLRRNKGSEFSCMINEAKLLGMALGIPCLDGVEEAEAQCALLNSESLCDGCFSADSDIFLFGARTVYRDICLGDGGHIICYEMADIEEKLGLGRNSLIALALLLGSDYSHGVHGFGPELACRAVKSIGYDVLLQRLASEGVSFLKKSKIAKKQVKVLKNQNKENCSNYGDRVNGSDCHSQTDEFIRVIDAYLKPNCHLADSKPVYRALALYPFQRTELQHICTQLFEWPPEKTDEYMLPKIAERELRKFANLRISSSELGAQLPLDKMPIKCPVSEIIKERKVQGKECFEVSWDEIDGLKTSIVPADLVRSACPEKILEFEEKRAEKNKNNRKSRPKKIGDKTLIKDIDQKLHNLLLEVESDKGWKLPSSRSTITSEDRTSAAADTASFHTQLQLDSESDVVSSFSRLTMSNDRNAASEVDAIITLDSLFQQELESKMDSAPIKCCSPCLAVAVEKDVIDLSSPSPEQGPCNVSRCQGDAKRMDVIYLSDSDTEISPEHARKVRELRSFLASLREEIS